MKRVPLDLNIMPSLNGDTQLQVMTVTEVLTQGEPLQVPVLITQIDSQATLKTLKAALQAQFPRDYTVSLLNDLQETDPTLLRVPLKQLAAQPGIAYPVHLYLPAQVTKTAIAIQRLVDVVSQLRDPAGGCPWDLEQTPQTLTPYILEEAYEAVDAIGQGDPKAITDELGDLLLQVVLQAQIASEQDDFSLENVAQSITNKMIRRHPHVFGEAEVETVDEVRANWDAIKATEQDPEVPAPLSQKLQKYNRSLPPLMAGAKLSAKAAAAGLEWPDIEGVWTKFYEELAEFQEALLSSDLQHQTEELGDLLFTLVNVARWCELDPSAALRATNEKLVARVQHIEAQTDKSLIDHSLEELEALWQQAKQDLSTPQTGLNRDSIAATLSGRATASTTEPLDAKND